MKLSLNAYVFGLIVAFVYAVVKHYVPTLPFDEATVAWVFQLILAVFGVDVVAALRNDRGIR